MAHAVLRNKIVNRLLACFALDNFVQGVAVLVAKEYRTCVRGAGVNVIDTVNFLVSAGKLVLLYPVFKIVINRGTADNSRLGLLTHNLAVEIEFSFVIVYVNAVPFVAVEGVPLAE